MPTARDPKPADPPARPDSFFDLSFNGNLPQLLRKIADGIDSRDCEAEQFDWSLNRDHLQFTARLSMRPKG